ncbi:MAG: zf-TFIIB domain-containing protein [Spirulina sp. SIO3F2]|nr:zf-TFIIB domain-containing protein [Spirulina sp. SIO3F2]
MKCPACKGSTLQTIHLESHLKAAHCPACEGKWITADDYWHWLEQHGDTLPEKEPEGIPIKAADQQQAKLCPDCQRIMLRYKVGHGLNFRLDQCGSCNGIWFDANEWEALKQRNLHDEVHLIFSAPWQSQIRKDEARQLLEGIYAQTFQTDYAKVQELKTWLDPHPQRAAILDYLASLDPYSIQRD